MAHSEVNGQRRLLLLVDADTALHPFIQAALRRAPYAPLRHMMCHPVVNADQLRAQLQQHRYQVALISLESVGHPTWPLEENAHRTMQLIREASPDHQPPVVAMTSVGTLYHRDSILRLGFSGYLCKPFTLSALFQELAAALTLNS